MMHERKEIDLGFSEKKVLAGLHVCYIYREDEERMSLLASFLQAGKLAGDKLLYVADGIDQEELRNRFHRVNFDFGSSPLATVASAQDIYFPDGRFSVERMLARLRDFYEEAMETGFAGGRVTGEMIWLLRGIEGADGAIEYEARLTRVLETHPCTAICQYDARKFSGATLMDVLSVHPYVIVQGQLMENPYFIPPEEFLRRYAPAEKRLPV